MTNHNGRWTTNNADCARLQRSHFQMSHSLQDPKRWDIFTSAEGQTTNDTRMSQNVPKCPTFQNQTSTEASIRHRRHLTIPAASESFAPLTLIERTCIVIIETGLFENMVSQRNGRNVSEAIITGRTKAKGDVRVRVTGGGKAVAGLANAKIGKARGGKFEALLKGIPAGGPYEIELTAGEGEKAERLRVGNVLVGDVWILGGQSNMQGCGYLKDRAKPQKNVRAFFTHDAWEIAQDPIHNLGAAVDDVHHDFGVARQSIEESKKSSGVGPGVAFGQEMARITGVPQGVIACAHGGTSMQQWDPALKGQAGKSLYGAMLRRFRKNGGKVAGAVWYQGESDANAKDGPLYTQRMKDMIGAMRRDFKNRNMPFALVQIARVTNWGDVAAWNSIQDQQRRLGEVVKNCTTVPAIDLALEDPIHISGKDQQRLGKRLAGAMGALLKLGGKAPIEINRISVERNPQVPTANIVIEFSNVVGSLRGSSLASGFEITDGAAERNVYHVELQGNKAILRTVQPLEDARGKFAHYGPGTSPVCNITDEADRSLPVFGPLKIGVPKPSTGFPRSLEVSALQPSAGKLHAVEYPANPQELAFRRVEFPDRFCQIHAQFADAGKDVSAFFRCPIECTEEMKLDLALGYDGPVKVWWDGREVFHDPEGKNPAILDSKFVKLSAAAGRHEIMIALGSNDGKAWGVFLRLNRTDLPERLVKKGPEFYALPKFMV